MLTEHNTVIKNNLSHIIHSNAPINSLILFITQCIAAEFVTSGIQKNQLTMNIYILYETKKFPYFV